MSLQKSTRRKFLGQAAAGMCGLAGVPLVNNGFLSAPFLKNKRISNKVFVLGIDGMDPALLKRFMDEGELPTFSKLASMGYFGRLQTTLPPQSPVAWSSFITGTNPGGHGIFDFIHRDPNSFTPYLSTSRTFRGQKTMEIGKWSLPLETDEVKLLRRGKPFWSVLEAHGIPTSLFKLPANFPVEPDGSKAISGMGTPDLLGTYGTFTYFTDAYVANAEDFTGGRVVEVEPVNHAIETALEGPANSFRTDKEVSRVPFTVYRDPQNPVAKIDIQGREIILRQGEWSEWVPLRFEFLPMFAGVAGMVRFYMQEVHPDFRLYASPINIDPMDPILPICNPSGYSQDLSRAVGRFYTQGFPEDTKALSNDIFSNEEFLTQSKMVFEERLKAFEYELDQFREGLFFFYFSSIDQNTHMMWRTMDPTHPLYEPEASKEVKEAVKYFYRRMDRVLRQTLGKMDSSSTLLVMSDHGFAPFGREFHLSTWLVENGYTVLHDPDLMHETEFYETIDWSKTKAYAMGLNGIYLNLKGRETNGWLMPDQASKIKKEIIDSLLKVRDPKNGKQVVLSASDTMKAFSGPFLNVAPDIVLGYASGYRISDEAVLGKFPEGLLGDRIDKWSADHCMDPRVVPGIFLANKEVGMEHPGIWDLAPSILQSFGLNVPQQMDGKSIFKIT